MSTFHGERFDGDWSCYDVCPQCRRFEGEQCWRWNHRLRGPWKAPTPCYGRRKLEPSELTPQSASA